MTRAEPESILSHLKPHVNRSLKRWLHGSTEKSHELKQDPGAMVLGLIAFFGSLSTFISPGLVLAYTVQKNSFDNAVITSRKCKEKCRVRECPDIFAFS